MATFPASALLRALCASLVIATASCGLRTELTSPLGPSAPDASTAVTGGFCGRWRWGPGWVAAHPSRRWPDCRDV